MKPLLGQRFYFPLNPFPFFPPWQRVIHQQIQPLSACLTEFPHGQICHCRLFALGSFLWLYYRTQGKWTVQTEGMDGDESWGDLRQKRNLQEIRPSWFRRQEWDLPWRMVYRTWLCDRREMKLEKRGSDGLDMCWGESGDKDVGDGAARQEGKEGITSEDLWVEWRRTWR